MIKKHRLFFALEPGEKVRQEICAVQQELACNGCMVAREKFHITVAFLGMQPAEIIPMVTALAARVHLSPCTLVLDRIGSFRRAGVLWMGATVIPAALRNFNRALLDELESAEIGHDRKQWKPHVTLYRRLRNCPVIMAPVPVIWRLEHFSLIESVSVKNHVEYHRLASWECGSSVIHP